MTAERRTATRCPVCSGPATIGELQPEQVRCRNSACRQNHQKQICPRCKALDIAQATWQDNKWTYTCADCENTWTS